MSLCPARGCCGSVPELEVEKLKYCNANGQIVSAVPTYNNQGDLVMRKITSTRTCPSPLTCIMSGDNEAGCNNAELKAAASGKYFHPGGVNRSCEGNVRVTRSRKFDSQTGEIHANPHIHENCKTCVEVGTRDATCTPESRGPTPEPKPGRTDMGLLQPPPATRGRKVVGQP